MARLAAVLAVLAAAQTPAAAFSFVFNAPVQCADLTVTWQGGSAPYYLLVTPLYSTPQNITIPSNAYNGTHGSYTTPLRVTGAQSQRRFLLTMSDSTGFGSGGTSGLLTAAPPGSSSCNLTDPGTDFTYDLNSALQQCRPYRWDNYPNAAQPITIYGLIPLGKAFTLRPPEGDSFTWTTNVAAGTNLLFVVVDSRGRQGGSTDLYTVSAFEDASCINSDSPGSTAQSTATVGPTVSPTSSPSSSNQNATVIGASIATGAVFLIALASLIWFFLQRKHKRRARNEDESSVQGMTHKRPGRSVDLISDDRSGHASYPSPGTADHLYSHAQDAHTYEPEPYVLPPSEHTYSSPTGEDANEQTTPGRHVRSTSTTTATNKAQMFASSSGRSHGTQRFVLHTDAGEVDDDEIVELPPMYTQVQPRRNPPSSSTGEAAQGSHIDHPLGS